MTWYSKVIAVVLFVATFALGLYLGNEYQKVIIVSVVDDGKVSSHSDSLEKQEEGVQTQPQFGETTLPSKNITPADLGIKIGDTIGDFTLTELRGNYISNEESLSDQATLITYFAQFTGTSDLYGIMEENEMLDMWCFEVSKSDYTHIPRLKYDTRNPWFCFKNPDDIPEDVRKNNSEQKIRISGYGLNFVAKGSSDTTTFVKALPTDKNMELTTYTDNGYGYSFSYPKTWVLEGYGMETNGVALKDLKEDRYFQLYNFDIANAPGKDGCCGGPGRNKIEGGSVITLKEWPDKTSYTEEIIGGKHVYRKDITDDISYITTVHIPVPHKTDSFVTMSIYGDPTNVESVLETLLAHFVFM